MHSPFSLEELLRWRAEEAGREAPPAPRSTRLLELSAPWWERFPDKFLGLAKQLSQMEFSVGHALETPDGGGSGYPVPAVLVRGEGEIPLFADILYFRIKDLGLRLRFRLQGCSPPEESPLEVAFVGCDEPTVFFAGTATLVSGGDYRIELELPAPLAASWAGLKVTDRMPFRLILRTG